MKPGLAAAFVVMLFLGGCGGKEIPNSGTITLTNELYGSGPYYAWGLSFAEAGLVSTLKGSYDIDVEAGALTDGGPVEPFLSANTLEPAFALKGEYGSESAAIDAFNALTDVGTVSYTDLAAPLKANQVWVVRTRTFKYAKIRIIEVTLNTLVSPPYTSCKLEWVYQPDGSATFP
jgi:hypothetical protein